MKTIIANILIIICIVALSHRVYILSEENRVLKEFNQACGSTRIFRDNTPRMDEKHFLRNNNPELSY